MTPPGVARHYRNRGDHRLAYTRGVGYSPGY
jgi:hypothetical protein